jgi:probable HAF family extracellular repeat protein
MHRATLFMLIALALNVTALAATTPRYVIVDLGVQESGEGLLWQSGTGTAAPPYYPELGGSGGTIYASNSVADVGIAALPYFGGHAARWITGTDSKVTVTDLGVLPGAFSNGVPPISAAYGLNRLGEVVGYSDSAYPIFSLSSLNSSKHGFLWRNGMMTDLGAIAGQEFNSSAESINDSHEIVGFTTTISKLTGESLMRAYMYIDGITFNLTFYLVGGPTVLLSDATGIDCQGNIAATGVPAAGGSSHSYLLLRQGAQRSCPQ